MQSMKEKWLGFATDENVARALKDIRRVAAKHGIRHVSVQILDGDVYGYTNDAAAGPYNLEIGTSGLRVEAGQAQYFKSIKKECQKGKNPNPAQKKLVNCILNEERKLVKYENTENHNR